MPENTEYLKNGQDALSFRNTLNTLFNEIQNNKCVMDDIFYVAPINYGDTLPEEANVGRVFFLFDDEEN